MASTAELEAKLRLLEGKLRAAELANQELSEERVPRTTNVTVNSFRDRKIVKFTGKENIDEWIQTVKLYVDCRTANEQEKVNFIIDHLSEDAKIELRIGIDIAKATSDEVYTLLRDVYTVKDTVFELQQQFYARNQLDDESLSDYSHVLMNKLFLLQKKSPDMFHSTDEILKQRFAEGVVDLSLKRELKRVNRESEHLKFFQIRDLAHSWMKDSEIKTTSESVEVEALKQTVRQQEQKIEEITSLIKNKFQVSEQYSVQRGRGVSNFRSRGRFRGRGYHSRQNDHLSNSVDSRTDAVSDKNSQDHVIICHYCNIPNHIAPNCWKRRQDRKKQFQVEKSTNSNHSSQRSQSWVENKAPL